jgi:hypothetical protein
MKTAQTSQIAALNDTFRKGGFGVIVTSGVKELEDLPGLLKAVRLYDRFSEDNDPYGEHDFGSLMWRGEKVFWKVDYYDRQLKYGEFPLSRKCRRVLTVMLASEY